jgi:hypothetical protein
LRGWRLLAFYNVYGTIHANWVSKWLLFNVKLAFSIIIARTSYIFHYHGENKLHFPLSWREQVTFSSIMARTSYIFQYHGENKLHFSVSWREQVTFSSIMARTSYIFQYHGENKLHFSSISPWANFDSQPILLSCVFYFSIISFKET